MIRIILPWTRIISTLRKLRLNAKEPLELIVGPMLAGTVSTIRLLLAKRPLLYSGFKDYRDHSDNTDIRTVAPIVFAPDEMRCIALLATSLGILLHTLLGWCPQHVGCASAESASAPLGGHRHHYCQGRHHAATPQNHGTSTDQGQVPADPDPADHASHCCDHADCLFVSQAESIEQFDSQPVTGYAHYLTGVEVSTVQLSELRENSSRFCYPCSQGQSARIARGVWLI